MDKQDSPYWVSVVMESEETEERVREALDACKVVHEWTMVEMRQHWKGSPIKSGDLLPEMTKQVERLGIKEKAQWFSLVTTVNRAVARFHQEIIVDMVGTRTAEVLFPDPYCPPAYQLLDIQYRTVWRKYMAYHGRISTHYGSVFLEGEWVRVLTLQGRSMGVAPSVVPYLIYSATIRETEEGWQAHFNLHQVQSQQGKKRVKQP